MISIILPVYNTEKYIKDCINSIMKQYYLEFEVIVVDDGSSDNSINIIKSTIKDDKRFKIYHKRNGGISSARNFGITKASGKYVMFIDSDDCIQYNTLSKMIKYIEDDETAICKCEYESFIDKYKSYSKNHIIRSLNKIDFFEEILTLKENLYAWGVLIPKNFFDNIQFPNGKYFEDMATMYKIYNQANKIYIIDSKLYKYRVNPSSIIHTMNKNKISNYIQAVNSFVNFYKEKYDSNNESINLFLCESYIECYKFTTDKKDVSMYKNIYNFKNTLRCDKKLFVKFLLFNYLNIFRLYLLKK